MKKTFARLLHSRFLLCMLVLLFVVNAVWSLTAADRAEAADGVPGADEALAREEHYLEVERPETYAAVRERALSAVKTYRAMGVPDDSYWLWYQSDVLMIYTALGNVPVEPVCPGGWAPFFAYRGVGVCLLLLPLVLIPVLSAAGEAEEGGAGTRRGRLARVLRTYAVLLLVMTAAAVVFTAVSLGVFGAVLGGYSPLSGFVHVCPEYVLCPYIVTVGEYLAIGFGARLLVSAAFGSLLLTAALLFRRGWVTGVCGSVLIGVSLLLRLLPYDDLNHPLRLLNLFTAVDTHTAFSRYFGLNLCGECVEYLPALLVGYGLLLVLSFGLNCLLCFGKPRGRGVPA